MAVIVYKVCPSGPYIIPIIAPLPLLNNIAGFLLSIYIYASICIVFSLSTVIFYYPSIYLGLLKGTELITLIPSYVNYPSPGLIPDIYYCSVVIYDYCAEFTFSTFVIFPSAVVTLPTTPDIYVFCVSYSVFILVIYVSVFVIR